MTDDAPWTLQRVLRWTTAFFKEKGLDTARLDAELIIAGALGIPRIALYTDYERPLHPEELASIRERVRRRARREPIAYILGKKPFLDLELTVDPRVLIPRPETELLVDRVLARIAGQESPRVVDVGTGSGAIALAVAQARPDARIVALDASPDALAVAGANAERLGLTQVDLRAGDLLAPLGGETVDVVASNPPYIPTRDLAGLMPDVRDFEPRQALDGGPDGLAVIRRLVAQAARALRPGGALVLEIGHDQGPAVSGLLSADFTGVTVHRDLAGHDRVVEGTRT